MLGLECSFHYTWGGEELAWGVPHSSRARHLLQPSPGEPWKAPSLDLASVKKSPGIRSQGQVSFLGWEEAGQVGKEY